MPKVLRLAENGQTQSVSPDQVDLPPDLDAQVALIQALIPLGLQAVHDALQLEVERLAGPRYARDGGRPGHVRWSREQGSVYLLDPDWPIYWQPQVRSEDPTADAAIANLEGPKEHRLPTHFLARVIEVKQRTRPRGRPRSGRFSPRETLARQLAERGLSHRDIAERMGVAEGTVRWYLHKVRRKART